ncbi:MAG: diguanylate cyclase [Candidatus Aminicenantes bacterium]
MRRLIDNTRDVILEIDLKGQFIFGNRSAERLTGYKLEELLKMNMRDLITPSHIHKVESRLNMRKKGEEIKEPLQLEIIRKDGKRVPLEIITSPVIEDNKLVAVQGVARDLTEYRQMEAELKEAENRWRALFERSMDWVYIHDLKGNFIDANPPALKGLGYKKKEIKNLTFKSLLSLNQLPKVFKAIRELKRTGTQKKITRFKLKRKNGKHIFVETKASVIHRKGKRRYVLGIARDVTKRTQMEKELKEVNKKLKVLALTDDLTGLFNHSAVVERFKNELERAMRQKEPISLIMADLDHFKKINDKYGHLVGDQVLKETGRFIKDSFRSYDVTGRYGGEEFLIVMPNTRQKQAKNASERLRKKFKNNPLKFEGKEIKVSISIGLTTSMPHKDHLDAETLMKQSDSALYNAKQKGRDRVEVYECGQND